VETGPGTDVSDNLAGFISITPLRADLTAHDRLDELRTALE
jgi:5'-nucleotidase